MGLFYDSTYLLVILAALISMAVSARMNTIFSKYQTVRSYSGMTGREAAMRILHQAGIYDVTVRHVSGKLTDHYDPRTKTVNLSDAVYDSTSVAAIGVAAHECGHAVQHNTIAGSSSITNCPACGCSTILWKCPVGASVIIGESVFVVPLPVTVLSPVSHRPSLPVSARPKAVRSSPCWDR